MKYWDILWYSLQGSFMKNFIDVFQLVCFRNHFFVIIGFNSLFMTCNSVGEPNLICFIYIPQNNAWYIYYNFIAFDTWSNSMDIQTDRNILVDFLQILIYLALVATFNIKIVLLVFFKISKTIHTVVCKKVHKIWSVWCKMAQGEVGVSLPWWCHALALLAPAYWRLFKF